MSEEIWKDIDGYEGLYQVSNKGRVKVLERICKTRGNSTQLRKSKIESLNPTSNRYIRIGLTKNGVVKSFSLHRLVANAFVPNPENKLAINHKNGIKTDNRVENLEWVTFSENTRHAFNLGLIPKTNSGQFLKGNIPHNLTKVNQFDKNHNFIKQHSSIISAARYLGNKNRSSICKALAKKQKTAYGFIWEYVK